jgi:hypothetical protein
MNELVIVPSTKPKTPTLIALETLDLRPEPVERFTGIARILAVARTALTIWGGISLAGIAAAGVVYGHAAFSSDATAERVSPNTATVAALAPPAVRVIPVAAPAARRQVSPARVPSHSPARQATPVAAPAAAPAHVATAAAVAASAPIAATAQDVTVASLPPSQTEGPDPIVEARLPRPRPDEQEVTGSISQHPYDAHDPVRWSRRHSVWIYYANRYRIPPL